MPKFETIPKEELLDEEGVEGEESEPLAEEDAVSDKEKEAFVEIQRRAELGKSETSDSVLQREGLELMIESLSTDREKEVIRRRFFAGETPEEIAKDSGISKGRIKEIEARALRKLRHPNRRAILEDEYERERTRCSYILNLVDDLFHDYSKYKQNEEMGELLRRLRKTIIYLNINKCKLNSVTLDYIFDQIEAILNKAKYNKGKYNNQDINEFKKNIERLEKEKRRKK